MREPAAVVMNIRWSLKSNVKIFFEEIEPFLVEILDAEPNLHLKKKDYFSKHLV
jgi:hypothetical protein